MGDIMLWALRTLALVGALSSAVVFWIFAFGYPDKTLLFGLWAVAPFPIAYAVVRWLSPGIVGLTTAVAGFSIALVFVALLYADAVRSYWNMTESLSGLVAIVAPLWLYAIFGLTLVVAWIFDRRSRRP